MAALKPRHRRTYTPFATAETFEGLMADADLRARRGDFDQAALLAAHAARLRRPQSSRSDFFSAHLRAADLHRLARNYEAAEAHIGLASGTPTNLVDDASVATVLAAIHRDKGDPEQGMRIVQRAISKIGPDDAYAFGLATTSLGQLHLTNGDRSAAHVTLTRAWLALEDTPHAAAKQAVLKWLILAEHPHRRFKPGWRSLRLAAQRRTWWRAAETAVILIGGRPLYRLLHPRRRQLER